MGRSALAEPSFTEYEVADPRLAASSGSPRAISASTSKYAFRLESPSVEST
jgi:hypothetical protein